MDHSKDADTKFKKGQKSGPGRPKGQKNKATLELKEMILEALGEAGGVSYLVRKAEDPKTASSFLALIGKVLPMTIAGDPNAPVRFVLESPWLTKQIAQRNEGE